MFRIRQYGTPSPLYDTGHGLEGVNRPMSRERYATTGTAVKGEKALANAALARVNKFALIILIDGICEEIYQPRLAQLGK